jgi:hypothetical protein
MSFEVYVQRFKGGEKAHFPRSEVDTVFGVHMVAHAPGERFIELDYPTGHGGTLNIGPDPDISGFTLMSPGADEVFDDLFALMKRAGLVLYWPDRKPSMVVAAEETRAELPESMIEALGPGLLVRSGRDIIAAIKRQL